MRNLEDMKYAAVILAAIQIQVKEDALAMDQL
jgi:hypothetical protein